MDGSMLEELTELLVLKIEEYSSSIGQDLI